MPTDLPPLIDRKFGYPKSTRESAKSGSTIIKEKSGESDKLCCVNEFTNKGPISTFGPSKCYLF